jgi:hypothetical protein
VDRDVPAGEREIERDGAAEAPAGAGDEGAPGGVGHVSRSSSQNSVAAGNGDRVMQITPPARPRRHDGFNRWRDATTDRRGTAMTRTRTAIAIALTAAATALAGHQIVNAAASRTDTGTARSFVTPRLDGRRLDVRYSAARPADPAMTAARFCRLRGFETVAGYSTQPASATRTIGDFAAADGARTAFYAIRCERAADAASFARG